MAIIYKIQNKQNGKVYIGQTKRTLDWRLNNSWCGHFPAAFDKNSDGYLHTALRKYGKEAFTYEVIEERDNSSFNDNKDIKVWLDNREIYWISFYKSNQHSFGYNKTKGGSCDYKIAKHNYHSQRMTDYNNKCWSNEEFRKKRSKQVSEQSKRQWSDDNFKVKVSNSLKATYKAKSYEEKHISAMKSVETRRANGTLCHTESSKAKLSKLAKGNTNVKGRIYVHKEGKSRLINPDDYDKFIAEGFMPGRGKVKWS